jgi:hypothetical protein
MLSNQIISASKPIIPIIPITHCLFAFQLKNRTSLRRQATVRFK